jgi:hypothetical protein
MLRKYVTVRVDIRPTRRQRSMPWAKKQNQRSILAIRGGNLEPAGSLYESIKLYERPVTLGDLESGNYQNNVFVVSSGNICSSNN